MKKSSLSEDQERMQLFQGQLKQMTEDFDFMKRNKEEAKKQLDARFQDIERYRHSPFRKIQNSKDFIATEGKRINDTLHAFQHKFEHELKATRDDLTNQLNGLRSDTDNNFSKTNGHVTNLTNKLNEEKADRIKQFE